MQKNKATAKVLADQLHGAKARKLKAAIEEAVAIKTSSSRGRRRWLWFKLVIDRSWWVSLSLGIPSHRSEEQRSSLNRQARIHRLQIYFEPSAAGCDDRASYACPPGSKRGNPGGDIHAQEASGDQDEIEDLALHSGYEVAVEAEDRDEDG